MEEPASHQAKMQNCVACDNIISSRAKICPDCGTHQNRKIRILRRVTAIFSGISVILGVLVLAASNYPAAMRTLSPKNHIDVYAIETIKAGKSTEVTFINSGNTDVFISKVTFDSPAYGEKIGAHHQLVNRWLKPNELFTFISGKRTVNEQVTYNQLVNPSTVDTLIEQGHNKNKIRHCFDFAIMSSDSNNVPVLHRRIKQVDIVATINYSSSDGKIYTATSDRKISAVIGQRKGCKFSNKEREELKKKQST